jgi:hypothetical protein
VLLVGMSLETPWEHLGNLMGTYLELDGNTQINQKNNSPLPTLSRITIFLYLFFQCIAMNIDLYTSHFGL